jgi:cell division protein ZapE
MQKISPSITPLDYYRDQCNTGMIFEDPQQLNAIQHLQQIYTEILDEHAKRYGILSLLHKNHLVQGLYLWGGVGIGKTFLMDCFYHCLPFQQKMRMHFHQFMQLVHQELRKHQGEKDPLEAIAKQLAKQTILVCFDEFFVSDITDAMLLGRLFKALFKQKVCLVTTSNVAPDDLYKNGLQREQFLPAIAMLKQNTEVLHLPTVIDYRLRHLKEAGVFYSPLDEAARLNMEKSFAALAGEEKIFEGHITVLDREIKIIKRTEKIVWFDFADICTVPRSQNDYLAIAKEYSTVFISNVPIIPPNAKDMICLFISMVDVFYDARVRLVISAAEPVAELYSRGYMILEYTRTHSRLLEMQSTDYFLAET